MSLGVQIRLNCNGHDILLFSLTIAKMGEPHQVQLFNDRFQEQKHSVPLMANTFSLFSCLPSELRLRIWTISATALREYRFLRIDLKAQLEPDISDTGTISMCSMAKTIVSVSERPQGLVSYLECAPKPLGFRVAFIASACPATCTVHRHNKSRKAMCCSTPNATF